MHKPFVLMKLPTAKTSTVVTSRQAKKQAIKSVLDPEIKVKLDDINKKYEAIRACTCANAPRFIDKVKIQYGKKPKKP